MLHMRPDTVLIQSDVPWLSNPLQLTESHARRCRTGKHLPSSWEAVKSIFPSDQRVLMGHFNQADIPADIPSYFEDGWVQQYDIQPITASEFHRNTDLVHLHNCLLSFSPAKMTNCERSSRFKQTTSLDGSINP